MYAHISVISQDNTKRLFFEGKPFIWWKDIVYMLASILTKDKKENLDWLRYANKYAEETQYTDKGFYKEYDFVVLMLNTKFKY